MLPASPRGRVLAIALLLAVLLLVAAAMAFMLRVPISSEAMRQAVVDTLADRLDAEVELESLTLNLLPRLRADGTNLVIRHRGRRDVPPIVAVRAFSVASSLSEAWNRRVGHVRLDGLEITVPPDRAAPKPINAGKASAHDVVVKELIAADARLVMIPKNPEKDPRVWDIHSLRMESVSAATTMPFTATLTNAVPPGQIDTTGSFGPWSREDPAQTPLGGTFVFERADLGVFKGIAGTLESKGAFGGTLGRLEVQGETLTPDFTITVAGNPVNLETTYHAVVDGTDGDTYLERIEAMLGETPILAQGKVIGTPGIKGREVALDITIDQGRLDDVLRLAVKTPQPPMTGALDLETSFLLPPGEETVVERLRLDGGFTIDDGRFTDPGVQRQINELSVRARGRKNGNTTPPRVASDFSGTFKLGDSALSLSKVTFDVPGAVVELRGSYFLERETLNFSGSLFMDAKVSETQSGFKRLLLKVVDPLFRRNGRTEVPLKVTGTREKPDFGLDLGRVFRR